MSITSLVSVFKLKISPDNSNTLELNVLNSVWRANVDILSVNVDTFCKLALISITCELRSVMLLPTRLLNVIFFEAGVEESSIMYNTSLALGTVIGLNLILLYLPCNYLIKWLCY